MLENIDVQFLPHTADVRMQVSAPTIEELFTGALCGMNQLIKPRFCNSSKPLDVAEVIQVHSLNRSCLVIDVLSEILTLTQIQKTVFCELTIQKLSPISLTGSLHGAKVFDGFDEDLKAVTYHEAQINQDAKLNWTITIIFDI